MINAQLFPPDFRGKYPHMFPKDVAVWEKFLDKYGDEYKGFYYDFQCGEACIQSPHWEENYRRDAEMLSRLRIDAIGVTDSGYEIFEVKPRINATSIGQVLTYVEHFKKDNNIQQPVEGSIVTGQTDPNIIKIAESLGITVYVLE